MNWKSYFWPCAFFFLLGIMIGLASGVMTYRHRHAILRMSNRLATAGTQLIKPSPPAAIKPPPAAVKPQTTTAKPPTATAKLPTTTKDTTLVMASFESDRDLRTFGDSDIPVERSTKFTTEGSYSLKASFPNGGGAIGTWKTLPADWSEYETLRFDVYSEEADLPLSLLIKDSVHINYGERYNEENMRLRTGWNHIDIPLRDVARKINLKDIVQVRVFLYRVPGQHVLYFDNFRLEGRKTSESPTGSSPQSMLAGRTTSGIRVWVVGDSYKIRPDQGTPFNPSVERDLRAHNEIWNGAIKEVSLFGARNEDIAFQLIVEASGKPIKQVTVVPTDLVGPSKISRKNLQLFREHYLKVDRPSSWPQPSTGRGEYPDPLVPLDAPGSGEPFDVPTGHNQAVWVDISIPESAAAGAYTGTIKVVSQDSDPSELTLKLQVWDFTLPNVSHLTFWSGYYDLPAAFGIKSGSKEHRALERDVWKLAKEHRIVATLQYVEVRPKYTLNGNGIKVDWKEFDERVGPHMDGRPNLFYLPVTFFGHETPPWPEDDEAFFQMTKEVARHFDEKGWDVSKTFVYLGDEPKPSAFPTIRRLAGLVKKADPRIRTVVALIKFNKDVYDALKGAVDFWMVDGGQWKSDILQAEKRKGSLIGFYQQSEPFLGNESLDSDGLSLRTWPWIAWKHGADVVHLYSMTEWWRGWQQGRDPWTNPLNWKDSNGQGILIYPGKHLSTPQVIGSVRMKQVRRGMQDYEYLYLAKSLGADTAPIVSATINKVLDETYRGWGSPGAWERDPAEWLKARKKLASLILKAKNSAQAVN